MDQEMDSAAERQKPCPRMSRRLNHLSRGPVWIVSEYAVIHRGSKPSTEITSYKATPFKGLAYYSSRPHPFDCSGVSSLSLKIEVEHRNTARNAFRVHSDEV